MSFVFVCGWKVWHNLFSLHLLTHTYIDNVLHVGTAHKLLTQVARRTKGRTGTKQETDKVLEEEFGKGFKQSDRPPENCFKHHSFPLPICKWFRAIWKRPWLWQTIRWRSIPRGSNTESQEQVSSCYFDIWMRESTQQVSTKWKTLLTCFWSKK